MESLSNIRYLVFSGGGMKGISVIGALKVLEQTVPGIYNQISGFAGTSIGAIIALILCSGGDAAALERIVLEKEFTDITSKVNIPLLLSNHGLINTDASIGGWLSEIMTHYFGRTNLTFQQMFRQTNRELTVAVSNLTHGRLEYWNHKTAPDKLVLSAVCASACFPMLFTPIIIDDCVYVDGGLGDNFPLKLYPPEQTLGFNYGKLYLQNNPTTIIEYMAKVVNFIANRSELGHQPSENVIEINPGPILVIDFFLDRQKKILLMENGERCCKAWFLKRIPAVMLIQCALLKLIKESMPVSE